jgi:hypothetical protein
LEKEVSALLHITPVKTAMDLRRLQARTALTEQEYLAVFEEMPEPEQVLFFKMLDNPDIQTPEKYIGWLKIMKVL